MQMKALVTGASGFIGRHVVAELVGRGYLVARCDLVGYKWDALDLFREHEDQYDLVVHAAASSPHRLAIDREPVHFARNLQLDAAMFDWAVRTGQRQVLYLSSSAAYPVTYQDGNFAEGLHESDVRLDFVAQPDAAYGWTKLTGEKLAIAARESGLSVAVVRPFSGYGEDQGEEFPFRALVERARRREDPFVIWGSGAQVRDWIHVSDVVTGALAVSDAGADQPVNICTGYGTSIFDLANMVCNAAGYEPEFEFRLDRPSGVAYRVGDPTRFHAYHFPTVGLDEGVARAFTMAVAG